MKNNWLARAVLLVFVFSAAFLHKGPQPGSAAPRRIEVVVTKTFGNVTAPAGKSFVLLYWEEPGNNGASSLYSVFEASVNQGGVSWADRGKGTRVQANHPDGNRYAGYYRWPASITDANKEAVSRQDYMNYTYRVGTSADADYNEARVYPPAEHAHINYQKNSDTCSGCHSTHYAKHPMLLNERLMFNVCIQCHDGTGSKYDVLYGRVEVAAGIWVDSPAGAFDAADTTSFHNVFLEDDFEAQNMLLLYAPGGGGQKYNLTCTDCHSAHVTTRSSFYRLLKFRSIPVVAYSYVNGGQYKVHYENGMNSFCANCHAHYNYGDGTEMGYEAHVLRDDGGDGIKKSGQYYRHPTNVDITRFGTPDIHANLTLPVEYRQGGKYMTCATCHFAHGTKARGTQTSYELQLVGEHKYDREGNIIQESTMLKRTDGMGICLQCHLDQVWGNTGN